MRALVRFRTESARREGVSLSMNTTCQETESGEVIFEWHLPIGARLFLGAMLSFFAIFFGYHLFWGLIEYIRVASLGEWQTALPGILIVMALFLLFAVPCWAVCLGRHQVILDLPRGRILKVFDLRLYRRTRSYPIDQVQHVSVVRLKARQTRHSSTTNCQVHLRLDRGKPILVSRGDRPDHARMVAEQVAGHLGISAL